MAENKLTPQQDVVTRQFFVLVAQKADHDLRELKVLRGICLNLLNYDVTADGRFLAKQLEARTRPWSTDPKDMEGECEWLDDFKKAIKAGGKDARANNQDSFTPRSSEPTTDTPVRETLLRKDV